MHFITDRPTRMTHLAIGEAPGGGRPETEWGDQVSDEEYGATPETRR